MIAFKVGLKAFESPVNILYRGGDIPVLLLPCDWLQRQEHCIISAHAAFLQTPQDHTAPNPTISIVGGGCRVKTDEWTEER